MRRAGSETVGSYIGIGKRERINNEYNFKLSYSVGKFPVGVSPTK